MTPPRAARRTRPRGGPGRSAVLGLCLVVGACAGCSSVPRSPAARAGTSTAVPTRELSEVPCVDSANWDAAGPDAAHRRLLDVRCAILTVPRDHARPAAGTLPVSVVRVRSARQRDRIGSLVLNPGGPGASGLDAMPSWAASLPADLLERFDLVSFDPRGVGGSAPLTCPQRADARPPADLTDDVGFRTTLADIVGAAQTCAEAVAASGTAYGTDAVARDLDLLRAALGDDRLTYVGWSYGARLGSHYGHLFPDRVRALVLDSPPHPSAAPAAVADAQLDGFEAAFSRYADDCADRPTCPLLAGDPRRVLERVVRTAREQPIPSGRPVGDPPMTWDGVVRAVLGHLPAPEVWPDLDRALGEADRGDSGSFHDMLDALDGATPAHPDADSGDVRRVVLCTDTAPDGDVGSLRADAVRLARDHPTFGAYGGWWLFGCAGWTAPREPLPVPASTTTAPVLVVGGAADPSTPLGGARALAEAVGPAAALLTSSTPGHTSFGRSRCVDRRVVGVLVNADLAGATTAC